MGGELQGRKIAFLATDGVEQIEYTDPRKAVEEAGATAHLVALEPGEIQGFNHLDRGDRFPVDKAVAVASADDYDGLVLPGGVANPDALRSAGGKLLGNTEAVASKLFRDYLLPFEVASVFLLVAMIGAVVLGKRSTEKMD